MRDIRTYAVVALATLWMAGGFGEQWFDEPLEKYKNSSSGDRTWKTGSARWTLKPEDRSTCSIADHRVKIETQGAELTFKPYVTASDGYASTTQNPEPYNVLTKIVAKGVVFTAFRNGEELEGVANPPRGGISMKMRDDGSCTFIGWVSSRDSEYVPGRWVELSAAGVAAKEYEPYDVTVESDCRCIPVRIRYSVNDAPLKDANGEEWFSVRAASMDPSKSPDTRLTSLCFNGSGSIGPLSAETTSLPTARGTVTMPRLALQGVGSVLNAADFVTEGAPLGSNVSCRWYLIDASGMPVEGSDRGTGSSYAISKDDFGHWVAVDVSDENGYYGTGKFWCSDLPVMYIESYDAKGYLETDDEVAESGKTYLWSNDDDVFTPIPVATGDDLAPYRAQYGKIFLEDAQTAWPTSKKEDHKAKIYLTGIPGKDTKAQYDADGTLDDDGKEIVSKIHVRGNSTAGLDKKPYKIKLGKKADLLGLGGGVKNKHWVLLANCYDESLMRNKLSYDYSGALGLVYMHSDWVDVVMNGKFVGNYQLCQHIRVAEERINIYDWSTAYEEIAKAAKKKANTALTSDDQDAIEELLELEQGWMTDGKFTYKGVNYQVVAKGTPGPDGNDGFIVVWKDFKTDITGGYIFELDFRKCRDNVPWTFSQSHLYAGREAVLFELAMNTPEFCFSNAAVSNYIWECWQDIGEAWTSGTGYNSKNCHYSELCDFDSMVNYWLCVYVPGNNDAVRLSRYAYKDLQKKVVFGPAWDYDWGVGSLQVRRSAVTNESGKVTYTSAKATGWIPSTTAQNYMGTWNADPYFMYMLREKYWATRDYLRDMVKDDGLIDQNMRKLEASARANDLRWNNRIGFFGNSQETGDADTLKKYFADRFAWLDEQFASSVGAALANLTKTVSAAGLRYVRSADIRPTIQGATPRSGSPETDVLDVELSVSAPVMIEVAVPTANAASLDVCLNGLCVATEKVLSQKATVIIPAAAFRANAQNFLELRVKKSDGTRLASNVALLTVKKPLAVFFR